MSPKYIMSKTLLLSVLCMPSVLLAQDAQMSEEQMQQMQDCMANMDQHAMDAYAAKGEKVNAEIKKLCAAGKRDEAQKMAADYGKEMASSKEMQAMQKCGGMANQMAKSGSGEKPGHVCDGM